MTMNESHTEIENIKQRYLLRRTNETAFKNSRKFFYNFFISSERELKYIELIIQQCMDISQSKILEIGAGVGSNIFFFLRNGFQNENIYANELLEERFEILKKNFPQCNLFLGDASQMEFKEVFDIVFQSTVFTSILDDNFKIRLAMKMFDMVKPGGMILWYDFRFDNPKNKDVKGVKKKEVKRLFAQAKKIKFYNVTLAPPIGRKIGKLYTLFNFLFPFLRTHIVAAIYK